MDNPQNPAMVKELHRDLTAKYRKHATTVEQYWRSFDQRQRTECMRAGAADGEVLKHPLDRSMGQVYKVIPELNLRDIAEPQSDFLLDLLKHRATTSLLDQYMAGPDGDPGDHAFIKQMMETRNLGYNAPRNSFTLFMDESQYGQSMDIVDRASEVWTSLAPAVNAGVCVPRDLGELILQRQIYTLQALNIVIDDILDIGSRGRDKKARSKPSRKGATDALAKLSLQEPAKTPLLPDLVSLASGQKAMLEEFLELLSTEPVVLTHAVNLCFFTRPELLPDERGRILPAHTDKYISGAVLEAVHEIIKALAIWSYIEGLLGILVSIPATDKVHKSIVLQEVSNLCHLEYGRAQSFFRRNIQSGSGSDHFQRLADARDKAGNVRVVMKGNPEALTAYDPQLHYILRLCQSETTPLKAKDWIKKLNDLHKQYPDDLDNLEEREVDSFSDLAVITSFISDLSPATGMPSLSRKKNQIFTRRIQDLDAEMNGLKSKIDLRDFAVPIDNLLEPGVAIQALTGLDQFIIENTGTKMGFLYQDLIEECITEIEAQHQIAKNRAELQQGADLMTPPPEVPQKLIIEQRKQKAKTRPTHSSAFEIVATTPEEPQSSEQERTPPFKVRPSTAEVFTTLFSKAESRGSLSWTSFVAAMTDLGFFVEPRYGSVYTFSPPENMDVTKSLTLHRPHKSEIDGYRAIIYRNRLKRVYGWDEKSFEVDEARK